MRVGPTFTPTRETWETLRFAGRAGQHLLYVNPDGELFEYSPVVDKMWKVVTG